MASFGANATSPSGDDPAAAAELAARIRAGDVAAEEELVARYRPGLLMLLRKRLKDPALADDYCQEVFRIAFQALRKGQLTEGAKLAAYLWGIARNLANSELRRQYRQQPSMDCAIEADARPDEQMLNDERARLLRQAVALLSRRDRAVLAAFYLQDTTKEEICRRLGLSGSQFDVIKWRALKRLRTLLAEDGEW